MLRPGGSGAAGDALPAADVSAPAHAPPPAKSKPEPWLGSLQPVNRLILRWAFIAVVTIIGFHRSLASIIDTTRQGGMNGYVWMVPVACVLAAIGVARRNRTELPIHDRQTDVIVGIMGMVFAGLLHAVLLPRYSLFFHLLRLDLFALWVFVLSASIAVFGLRPVTRFAWVWFLLSAIFPLPYHLIVIMLGGTPVAAGMGTLFIAATATGIAVGRRWRRGFIGGFSVWPVGLAVLAVMAIAFPSAPLLAYQLIPSLSAICLVGLTMYLLARRDLPKHLLDRKIEPLAARQVWSAMGVVLVIGLALSFVRLPVHQFPEPTRVDALTFDAPLNAPPGWHIAATRAYPWVTRLYGPGAEFVRQQMVAETGDPRFDKLARPRTVVVDATTTRRPFALSTYPDRLVYRTESVRISSSETMDLGYGVVAVLFTAVDDKLLVTWNGLQWAWGNGSVEQRVQVISVDNHDDDAPFPHPTGGVVATLNTLFTVLFRGNAVVSDAEPNMKDTVLLSEFGRGLVRSRLEPLGIKP